MSDIFSENKQAIESAAVECKALSKQAGAKLVAYEKAQKKADANPKKVKLADAAAALKAELADVINRIADNDTETVIRLAMLFYRDTDDMIPFAYFDDNADNVNAANQRGWHGFLYQDAESFYRTLTSML